MGKSISTVCACSMAVGAVLGLAQPSLSAVHYSGLQNLPLNAVSDYQYVDFAGIGQATDFQFTYSSTSYTYTTGTGTRGAQGKRHPHRRAKSLKQIGKAQNGVRGTSSNMCYMQPQGGASAVATAPGPNYWPARNFSTNYNINGGLPHWRTGYFDLNGNNSSWGPPAKFNSQTGYIGVRIPVTGSPGNYYYGWIRYQGYANGTGRIIDWAYEDQQDLAIAAGSLVSANAATPVPALNEWGMLILFALLAGAGVAVSRRKRAGS